MQSYPGSVVIVSHDKYFLNRMVNKIAEIYQQELHLYTGNYSFYEQEKALRIEMQQRAFENQQEYIRQQERFIERFKAKATKATQAQSAMKRLEKLERIEQVEIERPNIKINFKVDTVPGKIICSLENLTKKFGEQVIVQQAQAEINRGDKIALIGANGKGKSTVLRIVAGTESFDGKRQWGHNVMESFYAQHQLEALNLSHTILEEMTTCGSGKTELELRSLLGCFLFSGDDTDKKIKVLSGGEKARVALAKVIAGKSNFLLLDEPTNHLDMHSVELLAEALRKYEGTYILVSHDRYFIAQTANKIWEIEHHQSKEFKGTYDEWVEWKERMKKLQQNQTQQEKVTAPVIVAPVQQKVPEIKQSSLSRDEQKELQRLQKQIAKLEEKIKEKDAEKTKIELELSSPDSYANMQKFNELDKKYHSIQLELNNMNTEYEGLFEKLLELESK